MGGHLRVILQEGLRSNHHRRRSQRTLYCVAPPEDPCTPFGPRARRGETVWRALPGTALSQGIEWGGEFIAKKIIIAPAFWMTPLIFFDKLDKDTLLLIFGARPADMSVIPGETLPDGLVRSLKALADPTRLKILFYLSHESLSPSELVRRLHLRAPTVTHHLNELRLASLVNVTIEGQEKKYKARREALQSTFTNLQDFLKIAEK